ncbi:MAG: glucose 1-dehydrogenase [Kurthia sp.]|nr:glucose 1-dehydrogenase [Candidatus Kurthia equi]
MNLFDLTGKVALVTGASRGIGKEIAVGLAKVGVEVLIVSRTKASDVVAEIESFGGKAHAFSCDLGNREQRQNLFNEVMASIGKVDILVNNAGIQKRFNSEDFPLEEWDELLEVNTTGVFHLCQLFGKEMLKEGYGKIVNMASVISFQGGIKIPAYAASKAAVMNFSKTLSNEWASKGININCIAPGYIATDMNDALINDNERNQQILDRLPAKRWGKASDMVGAVIFLSSAASDYINGHTIMVDGGWMGR